MLAPSVPKDFQGQWRVCYVKSSADHVSHMPAGQPTFLIAGIPNGSGQLTVFPQALDHWAAGWLSLTLTVVGSKPAQLPPKMWEKTDCMAGPQASTDPTSFTPTEDTLRLRGATCLPDGVPNHIAGTCGNDDPAKKEYHYHEIVMYARPPSSNTDVPHLLLAHCSRDELRDNGGLMCPDPEISDRNPHPGHVHAEVF